MQFIPMIAIVGVLLAGGVVDARRLPVAQRDPAPSVAASSSSVAARKLVKGKEVYMATCRTCHELGAMGAPRLGNRNEWAVRIAKGRKILLENTLKGFGVMPPKGGNPELTRKQVSLALDYMLSESK